MQSDDIGGAADFGQQIVFRNHQRQHIGTERIIGSLQQGDQFDAPIQPIGVFKISSVEVVNPLQRDVFRVQPLSCDQVCEDHQLVAGIKALDVVGRVLLGKS